MNNPVLALVDWIEKQDQAVAGEIAFMMAAQHPSFDFYDVAAEDEGGRVKAFCQRIKDFSGSEVGNAGFLVAFRAVFDFVFVSKRGTEESWEETKNFMERVAEEVPSAKLLLLELPARKKAWIDICQDWIGLKESVLSDKNISKWDELNMLERSKAA